MTLSKSIIDMVHKVLMEYTEDTPLNGDELEQLDEELKKLNGDK